MSAGTTGFISAISAAGHGKAPARSDGGVWVNKKKGDL